ITATQRTRHQSLSSKKKLTHLFVPIRYHGHSLPVHQTKVSFFLRKDLQNDLPPAAFISWLDKRINQKRQLLIFVPTVLMAENLFDNIGKELIRKKVIKKHDQFDYVHAEDTKRAQKVQRFRDKELTIIITTKILER